jgi:hypothetical protein
VDAVVAVDAVKMAKMVIKSTFKHRNKHQNQNLNKIRTRPVQTVLRAVKAET